MIMPTATQFGFDATLFLAALAFSLAITTPAAAEIAADIYERARAWWMGR